VRTGQYQSAFHVVINGVNAAAHEVRLVPESCATGVLQELLPPSPVRLGTGPAFEAVEIAPASWPPDPKPGSDG
jgi:hypothetical protein